MKIIVKDIFNGVESEIMVPDDFSDKVRELACDMKISQAESVLVAVETFIDIKFTIKTLNVKSRTFNI